MEVEDVPVKRRRPIATILFVIAALVAPALFFLWWAYPPYKSTRSFEAPKIVSVHLDEEPFARLVLQPGESYRPIEVMAGTEVPFLCSVVSVSPGRRFHLSAFGQEYESDDCLFDLPVPTTFGIHHDLMLTYWDDPEVAAPTDSLTIPAVVVAPSERVEFQALEDAAGNAIRGASVPGAVRVFARAITNLPDDGREYAALFFTADPRNGVPVLELMPVREGEKPEPMIGQILRYRSYGKHLAGYALWSPEPVRMGGRDGDRQITDVYIGIFRRDELDAMVSRLLRIEQTGADTLTVTPQVANIAEVAEMTVHGRLMTPPLHLVRSKGKADSDLQTVPLPTVQP